MKKFIPAENLDGVFCCATFKLDEYMLRAAEGTLREVVADDATKCPHCASDIKGK